MDSKTRREVRTGRRGQGLVPGGFQFLDSDSCTRVCGNYAMRERKSASQACGSTSLILMVTMRVYIAAARSPPRWEPAYSHNFLPSAIPRMPFPRHYADTDIDLVTPATRRPSQQLMVYANFARHVRPGALRQSQLLDSIPGIGIREPARW